MNTAGLLGYIPEDVITVIIHSCASFQSNTQINESVLGVSLSASPVKYTKITLLL
jgi:hypothetical protein